MSSAKVILNSLSSDALKAKLDKLDALLIAVDLRSKQTVHISPFANRASLSGKYFCLDCGIRLKTHKAVRCSRCNMRLVGKNHLETRKKKGGCL